MIQTHDMATDLIDNRHLRFDASVRATVKPMSVPSIVDAVESVPQRRTAELFVAPHKRRLLSTSHSRSHAKQSESPSLFCVVASGHPAEPVYVPDELLTATSSLPAEEELPETVRLSRPLRLKEQPPIRRVEQAHPEVPQKTCDFRVIRVPMPSQVRFAGNDVPVSEEEEVLRPIFSDTSSEQMTVLPFVAKTIKTSVTPPQETASRLKVVAPITFTPVIAVPATGTVAMNDDTIMSQLSLLWPHLSKTAQLTIMNLVAK